MPRRPVWVKPDNRRVLGHDDYEYARALTALHGITDPMWGFRCLNCTYARRNLGEFKSLADSGAFKHAITRGHVTHLLNHDIVVTVYEYGANRIDLDGEAPF